MNKKIAPFICALSLIPTLAFAATSASQKAGQLSQEHSVQKKTADSQMTGTDADVAVTRKIRDRLTDMDELSMRAQNVTIVTKQNNVTLKGEVDKQEEIQKIMNVAQESASGKTISNQLRVHK
jgi:osmotically-inducible protein OsmY